MALDPLPGALSGPRRRRLVALALGLSLAFTAARAAAAEYEVCLDVTPDIRALGSDDLFESEPAADRLSALGPAAWPALVVALEREGPAVRDAVILILVSATNPTDSVRQAVARVARNDAEPELRADAVAAVRKLAGKQSHDVVVAALDDPSPEVRRKAIAACTDICTGDVALARLVALALTDEPVVNALQAQRTLWHLTAEGSNREIVGKIRAETIAMSSASTGTGREGAERRTLLAALLLAAIDDVSRLDDVARATRADQVEAIRLYALHALGRLGGADRVALVAGLQQESGAVAVYAHDALRRMSERGISGAGDAAAAYTGPRAPQPLPRP